MTESPNEFVVPEVRRLDATQADFLATLDVLLTLESDTDRAIVERVDEILRAVRATGDAAVLEYTRRFDGLDALAMVELELPRTEWEAAWRALSDAQRAALEVAAERIRRYHERQKAEGWMVEEADGTRLGLKVTPLDRVGLYVPGGRAAYPSSVLMNAIPAKVAGVSELIMVTPTPHGERNPLVLAAAYLAGVDRVFTIGGAQAVAALAYGTQTIPQVDKIVGPGNAYVAEAKRRVFGVVGIDMIAGPSEVLVLNDGSGNPDWVAMDLFAQAEHDELAQAILVSTDRAFLERVQESIARLLPQQPRRAIIAQSLANRGALIYAPNRAAAIAIANRVAPEHLELAVEDPEAWEPEIRHAGAIFLGHWSVEAFGDYCAGPNHVLPTMRSARFSSPLGVWDFQKRTSLLAVSREGAAKLAPIAGLLADGEGLAAHAASARFRG
ncbi:MAG: histidinol dehydrogenase [Hydrogenophilus thermoluteolus]|uniref:histidinol dehydrogenase n=1 Tax=Hydrogenophilus thermoluteolus TaxID=297 RepID=UPI0024A31981|nr:histidinol dehydrogenase [Hydrogenophilus thermoluteolus]GLW59831.1 histidinol dehydrogenase [Hydrogenophilus thermoluteolus]